MEELTRESGMFIMELLREREKALREQLYAALYAGGTGAAEAKALGVALRAAEGFDALLREGGCK